MSVIQSISDVAKFSGECLASVPAEAWLITAVVLPTFLYLRSLSPSNPAPKKQIERAPVEKKQAQSKCTMEVETVMVLCIKNDLRLLPTQRFNELLRKGDLSLPEQRDFRDLWGAPEFVSLVDARSLPSEWVGKLQTQFGSEKVLTDS